MPGERTAHALCFHSTVRNPSELIPPATYGVTPRPQGRGEEVPGERLQLVRAPCARYPCATKPSRHRRMSTLTRRCRPCFFSSSVSSTPCIFHIQSENHIYFESCLIRNHLQFEFDIFSSRSRWGGTSFPAELHRPVGGAHLAFVFLALKVG